MPIELTLYIYPAPGPNDGNTSTVVYWTTIVVPARHAWYADGLLREWANYYFPKYTNYIKHSGKYHDYNHDISQA